MFSCCVFIFLCRFGGLATRKFALKELKQGCIVYFHTILVSYDYVYSYQSNKCMKKMFLLKMKTHFLWKIYKIFCFKELSRAINWEQLSGGAIILGEGNYPRGDYPGGNCPGNNCTRTKLIIWKCLTEV